MHESHVEILKELNRQFNELLPTINENIEKYRKGSFTIKVLDKNGVGVKVPFKLRQVSHDFDFGTNALMLGAMGDKEQLYRDSITNLFNLVTTTFCWNLTEPNPNEFRFEEGSKEIYRRPPPDRVLKFCEENNLRAKGQPLFCGRWNPDWVPQDFEKFKKFWINYIENVAKRYDGKFSVFDVVNESYEVDTSWKNMEWIPTSYNEFVKWLLKTAGNVFSNTCIMERNEATKVNFGEYANRYYNDNKEILDNNIRLDAIGHQFHIFSIGTFEGKDAGFTHLYENYMRTSSLNVPMYITEITFSTVYHKATQEEGEEVQAFFIEKLYKLWFSIPMMRGIIYWNIKDGDAWGGEVNHKGGLIDENLRRKKSYIILEQLIKNEWNTKVSDTTNDCGIFNGSMFFGDYELTVYPNGKEPITKNITLNKKTNEITIII